MSNFALLLLLVFAVAFGLILLMLLAAFQALEAKATPKGSTKARPVVLIPMDQEARAFQMLDRQEAEPTLHGNVFPLAPQAKTPEEPKKRKLEIQVPTPGHPCRFLDGTVPRHFKEGEVTGVCRSRAQEGRICFFASPSATFCEYFDPKVKPTRLKRKAS